MKVVINTCFGGFGLTDKALARYNQLAGTKKEYYWDIERNDPFLVQTVEELGCDAAGDVYALLKVIDVPDDVDWYIHEYDGLESIHEQHRVWD